MSATLSPAEQAEVSRFGMFDEETFRDIVRDADPVCADSRCDRVATHSVHCNQCQRFVGIVCHKHAAAIERAVHTIARDVKCGGTGPYSELFRVVPL